MKNRTKNQECYSKLPKEERDKKHFWQNKRFFIFNKSQQILPTWGLGGGGGGGAVVWKINITPYKNIVRCIFENRMLWSKKKML